MLPLKDLNPTRRIPVVTYSFISENEIVAVFGDENQLVRSDMWKINGPLLSRGGICAKSGGLRLPSGGGICKAYRFQISTPFQKLFLQPISW